MIMRRMSSRVISWSVRDYVLALLLNSAPDALVITGMLLPHRVPPVVKTLAFATLVLVLAAVLQAQTSISGKWQGTTRNGMHVVLDLKATEQALTGTLTRDGQASTITQGKVSKTTFTFNAVLGEQTEALTGEVDGEQLKIWLDRQGRDGTVVFNRAKE
jgi:hypothetical protein